MKKLIAVMVLCPMLALAGNWVVYVKATGKIVSHDKTYTLVKGQLNDDGQTFRILMPVPVDECGIGSTTNDVTGKTNIAQLASFTPVTPKDFLAEIDQMEDKLKAVVLALVKTINLRLPAGQKITAEELKAAIKEEL